ncbi:oxidized low-density lipoprotein receptor 1 isoform X2 [Oryzias melastigma]|uniref:oxidized low-density lipoprotein receptor 1 isoform X2 n=1 Tax=Oryzias melastigma TaxID=30732 RepID=UPI000CF828F9|nr:oxidized low-density lipoprotein receptor 1 isoform X2 [Oryzias melastigma]
MLKMEDMQHSFGAFKKNSSNSKDNKEEELVYVNLQKKTPKTSETQVQASSRKSRVLLVSLGIICFFLCLSIIIIIICYFVIETNKQKQNLSDLEAKNEQLTLEKRDLQIQTEDLRMNMTKLENLTEHLTAEKKFFENQTKEMTVNMTILQTQIEQLRNNTDRHNRTKTAIIKYSTFPVDFFCSDGVCKACPKDWIQFQESCYFFNHSPSPWKTWDESRQLCQSNNSDLVVISSQEEQTFIKSTIKYYYDFWHGYWIGLRRIKNNWIWVDDSQETLGYWNNLESSDNFATIIQNATLNESWIQVKNSFLNRFICEIEALVF